MRRRRQSGEGLQLPVPPYRYPFSHGRGARYAGVDQLDTPKNGSLGGIQSGERSSNHERILPLAAKKRFGMLHMYQPPPIGYFEEFARWFGVSRKFGVHTKKPGLYPAIATLESQWPVSPLRVLAWRQNVCRLDNTRRTTARKLLTSSA